MFCTSCGEKVPDESVFCPLCGQKIASPANEAPVSPVSGPSVQPAAVPVPAAYAIERKPYNRSGMVLSILGLILTVFSFITLFFITSYSGYAIRDMLFKGVTYSELALIIVAWSGLGIGFVLMTAGLISSLTDRSKRPVLATVIVSGVFMFFVLIYIISLVVSFAVRGSGSYGYLI